MQSSYECVKRALHFEKPDRLPVMFNCYGNSDVFHVGWTQKYRCTKDTMESTDEWGCVWTRTEIENIGYVTKHPLADWEDMKDYEWPDPDNEYFYEGMEERFEGSEGKYVRTSICCLLFERMQALHGLDNVLIDLYEEPELLGVLADKIVDFDIRMIQNISKRFPGRIHGFEFSDDWGTQLNSFISVEMFNEFFAPRYRKIFDACKEAGWDVWMHSCGKINNLIPSLIDCGVTSLSMKQCQTTGISEIGERFAGKVCFHTCCDIQRTLINGTDEEIEEEAIRLMNEWGTKDGGFILIESDAVAIGTTEHRVKVMYDAFLKNDPWKQR